MDGIISPNMLKTYELCPKKFCFRYVKNISMPSDDSKFETGKNIHALASYYLRNGNVDKMEQVLNENEKSLWQYLKSLKYLGYECLHTEYNLAVKSGAHFFGGRLDALLKADGMYYILDYKTGAAPQNAKYDYQTMIYFLAVRAFYNTNNIRFVYLDLKRRKETAIELTEELAQEYLIKLNEIAKKIDTGDFSPKHDNCPCEYDIICY